MLIWSPLRRLGILLCLAFAPACGSGAERPSPKPGERPYGASERLDVPPLPSHMEAISPEWVEELKRLQGLTQASPGSAPGWHELGIGYEKCGMRELALVCYGQAQLRQPGNPRTWYRAGISHWRLGNLSEALHNLARAQELEPSYAPTYYRKGIIEMDAGEFDAAWASFTGGIAANPKYPGCFLGQARILLQRDEPEKARAILEPLAAADPADAKINNLLVTVLREAGVPTKRVLMETSFLGDTPDPAWGDPWQLELARSEVVSFNASMRSLLRDRSQAERALALMNERKAERPADWSFVDLHAQAMFQLDKLNEAEFLYKGFLKVEPNAVGARLQIGLYRELSGAFEQSLAWVEGALSLDPENSLGWAAKGRVLSAGKQYEAALPALQKARDLDPDSLDLLEWMLTTLVALQRWEETLPLFREYVARDPDNGNVWVDFARARIKIRSFKKAAEALDRADELNVGRKKMVMRLRQLIAQHDQRVRDFIKQKEQR